MRSSSASAREPPPVEGVRFLPLRGADLDQVLEIERVSFLTPWRREHFEFELHEIPWAVNRVARRGREVLGYVLVWHLHGELKINNIAVRKDCQGQGLGGWMLRRTLQAARRASCDVAHLEVRPSNLRALALYAKHGFVEIARRKNYYEREGEDALLMEARL
jgi:ribosomal-protein-alanine N-acetyltransferase